MPPNACSQGSPVRCTPTATAATPLWYTSRDWSIWPAGHARRGFVDVLKSLGLNPKKLPANPPAKARRALYALQQIRTLYAIERRIRDKPPDYRHLARQTESVPVLDKLRDWLDHTIDKVPPSTPLRKAMGYLHNQWEGLVRFCDDGRYGIDTNPVENAIRPFAVGRRNWLFADTVAGANASARLYSLTECAKANGLEPYAYLRHVFTELPKAQSLAEVEALLPTVSTPPPWRQTPSRSPSSPHVNSAVSGALTFILHGVDACIS